VDSKDPLSFVRDDFRDLDPYEPVRPLEVVAREIGLPVERIVKLDANENLYGPLPAVREAAATADLHIYPDPEQVELRAAIAAYLRVDPDQVVAGAGSDDLIDVIIRLSGAREVVDAPPTFGMYGFLSRIAGARVIEAQRTAGPAFEPDIPAIARAVRGGARIVFLASPNNPTGNCLHPEQIDALCHLDCLVVVDEAYAEFSGTTALPLLERWSNLVILRTFSKWAGLAGLRIGYAIAHPELIRRMMAIKQPYNVNVAADAAARAALAHRAEILETVRCIVAERERMSGLVGRLGWLRPVPSEANFVLFHVEGRPAAEVALALRRKGVLVRYYNRPGLQGYIRISAGRPEDTDRLLEALRALEAA
jgi:histidinol-phosphate aminotransferase